MGEGKVGKESEQMKGPEQTKRPDQAKGPEQTKRSDQAKGPAQTKGSAQPEGQAQAAAQDGAQRSGRTNRMELWRVWTSLLLAVLTLFAAQLASQLLSSLPLLLGLPVPVFLLNTACGFLYVLFAWQLLKLICRKILQLAPAECRITKPHIRPVWAVCAFLMPFAVTVGLLCLPGSWQNHQLTAAAIGKLVTAAVFSVGMGAGIVEEMIFRGVIMTALEHRWNRTAAILAPSFAFALLHVINGPLDFISLLQLLAAGTAVGVLFSLVTYESGSIWSSALMHGVWKVIMIGGILSIGTRAYEVSPYNYVLSSGSSLLTGGDFGIEASVFAAAAYLLFGAYAFWRWKKADGRPENEPERNRKER